MMLSFVYPFLAGFFLKQLDDAIDVEKNTKKALFFFILSVIFLFPFAKKFPELAFSVALAQVFAGKIDNFFHAILAFVLLFFSFSLLQDFFKIVLFFIAAFLDEKIRNEFVENYRPFLKIATIPFPEFLPLLLFDFGYIISPHLSKKFLFR